MASTSQELNHLVKVDSSPNETEHTQVEKPLSESKRTDNFIENNLGLDKEEQVNLEKTLSKMHFSEAAKQLLLSPQEAQKDLDSLQSIALTQEHLTQVKISLGAIIDSLQYNPSLISRAAKFWGELPLWQRILWGVFVSGPPLVIGFAAHIGFLVTISGINAIAYTTSAVILDDHHIHTKSITDKLKEGIFGIAEVLELTIIALDSIRQKLAVEVQKFKEENERLAKNVSRLNNEIETLSAQVEVFVETEKILRKTKEELENTARSLKSELKQQNEKIEANQRELEKANYLHQRSIEQLSVKVEELSQSRASLTEQLDRANKVSNTLQDAVEVLTSTAISDKNHQKEFQTRLESLLNEKSINFTQVADGMNKTEQELQRVKSELEFSNSRYLEMLQYQELLVRRLEQIDKRVWSSLHPDEESLSSQLQETDPPKKASGLLSTLGFLALPQIWPGNKSETPKDDKELMHQEHP